MNRDEARILLESTRPGGQDAADPRVAEALRLAEADPELARLLESQRAFDGSMAAGVRSIPVPAHLKASLLAPRRIVRPHFWQDWRTASAAAAAIVLLLAAGFWFLQHDAAGFAEFRRGLIEERGSVYARMDLESTDLARVRAPIGLEIQAETPEEIAVSIMADIIAIRRGAAIPSVMRPGLALADG